MVCAANGWLKEITGCAAALVVSASSSHRLRIDILHLAAAAHLPGLDGVVVVERVGGVTAAPLAAGRLGVAQLVGGAAEQGGGRACPLPGDAEAGQRLVQHRGVQLRRRPGAAVVGGNLDLGDTPQAGPGQPGYLIEADRKSTR